MTYKEENIAMEEVTHNNTARNKFHQKERIERHVASEDRSQEDEIDLVEVVKKLWRNRKLIIWVTVVFMVIGIVYSLMATPYYRATLTMYPATGSKKANRLMSMAASFGLGGGGSIQTYNIEDVIKSRKIAKEIVLHKWNVSGSDVKMNLIDFWEIKANKEVMKMFFAIKRCRKMISISTNKQSGLMTLSVLATDPILSSQIANYLGKAVTDYIQKHNGLVAEKNLEHIDIRLSDVKNELKEAELALKNFREGNRDVSSPQTQLEMGRLSRELDIKQGVYLTLNQQRELALIDKIKKSPVINTLDEAEVPIRREKPKRAMICIVFTFLGGIIGIGLVLLLLFLSENLGELRLARLVK
jgi:uncharacterized protein involved in exopolysaccharide biosynthesis